MPEFKDLVFCGYQGWFAAGEDNTLGRWSHWSKLGAPSPGNTAFELYPDVREYPHEALRASGYGKLGNGSDALLFGSERNGVVDLHFKWMKKYGIDGVAVQRFLKATREADGRAWRNKVAGKARDRAEAHGRHFYVMWDISGASWPADGHASLEAEIHEDYEDHVQPLTDSPQYARQNGKPVIAIWGLGFKTRNAELNDALATVAALHNDFGCYVALGVPYRWRQETGDALPGWRPLYESADMLIPWAVGRYRRLTDVDNHITNLWEPDKAFCDQRGIDLQRVIFPGFAWSNLKSHQAAGNVHALSRHAESQSQAAPRNAIPRRQGDFLWGQAFRVAQHGTGAFVAMFDEYDEGTAIAKAAETSAMIPTDEYFLTLDADGVRVASDHYLWLTGELTRMIKDPTLAAPERPPRPGDEVVDDSDDDDDSAPSEPQWTADEAPIVVEHAYRGLLARDADPGGRDHFAGRLMDGDPTERICRVLAVGPEFANKNAGKTSEELAEQLYRGILDRTGDSNGLATTTARIREGKIARRVASMLESDEFRNKFLN